MIRRLLRGLGVIVAVNLVGLPTLSAAKWVKLEADEFTIYGDVGERQVRKFARKYAAYRYALRMLLDRPERKMPRSLLILHADQYDFLAYTTDKDPFTARQQFSYSINVDGRLVAPIALTKRYERGFELTVEYHTQFILDKYGWNIPLWMSQGLGKVMSTVKYDAKRGEVEIGRIADAGAGLQSDTFYDWERFLFINNGSWEYRHSDGSRSFHAQAWALVHWLLLENEAGPQRFAELESSMLRLNRSAALEEVGGVPLERLNKAIIAHVREVPTPTVRFPFDADAVETTFAVSSLPEAELLAVMSVIASATDRKDQADLLYFQADQLAPDLPVVLEAGARWHLRHDEREEAVMSYRAAMENGSTNAYAYLASAQWHMRYTGRGFGAAGSGIPAVIKPALSEIERALELDSGVNLAYVLLGRAAVLEAEPDPEHLVPLSSRVGDDRWGTLARYYRGMLLQRLGRSEEAIADMALLRHSAVANKETRNSAQLLWANWQTEPLEKEINTLLESGSFDRAYARLESWWTNHPDADLRADARALEAQVADAEQSFFDVERQGLQQLLKQRDYDQAWTRVLELRDETDSASLREGFGRLEKQIAGVALWARVREATQAEDWTTVVTHAEAFLASQPEGHRSRAKVEQALADAQAALGE